MGLLIKVWDLPTRLFHWLLVLLMSASVLSAWVWENMVWHAICGYALLALWLFRLVWGFIGGHWSRFGRLLSSARHVMRHVQQPADWTLPGHNPLGSWSVMAMLLFIGLQIFTGMLSDDDAGFSGPLTAFFSNQWVSKATLYHAQIGKWVLLCLVVVHLLAITYHEWVKHQRLVRAMFNGMQTAPANTTPSQDKLTNRLWGLLTGVVCVVLVEAGLQWLQPAA